MAALRHAICNEVYENWAFADACRSASAAGYTGFEVAPFTLGSEPTRSAAAERAAWRDAMTAHGLTFVGLHWLLVGPKGLHVTTPDASVRARSWDYLRRLVDLCADLGPQGVMVFGSPKQRGTTDGSSEEDATARFVDGLAALAPHAGAHGVTVLVEALPRDQTDVVNSLDHAARIVAQIDHPAIRTMFDTHNAVDEQEPHDRLLERHYEIIRHVHVNETDGRHPGTGTYDFGPVLRTLRRLNYPGWVSLEAFDFTPGAERIARESITHLERQADK